MIQVQHATSGVEQIARQLRTDLASLEVADFEGRILVEGNPEHPRVAIQWKAQPSRQTVRAITQAIFDAVPGVHVRGPGGRR